MNSDEAQTGGRLRRRIQCAVAGDYLYISELELAFSPESVQALEDWYNCRCGEGLEPLTKKVEMEEILKSIKRKDHFA